MPVSEEEFVGKHKHVLLGMILDGMCSDRETRAKMVLNLPGLLELRMRAMYRDLFPPPPAPTNGDGERITYPQKK